MDLFPSIVVYTNNPNLQDKWLLTYLQDLGIKNNPQNPDIVKIDQNTGWGIDQIRNIKNIVIVPPVIYPKRAVLIFDSQNLNTESQNSLLKILEEPPIHTHFVLFTSNLNILLDTIKSRCQIIKLKSVGKKETNQGLKISSHLNENLDYSQEISKDKQQLITLIQNQIKIFQQQLLSKPSLDLAKKIQFLHKSLAMIQSNVNPTSALDYFYLSI